jgi:hypothetical protein
MFCAQTLFQALYFEILEMGVVYKGKTRENPKIAITQKALAGILM